MAKNDYDAEFHERFMAEWRARRRANIGWFIGQVFWWIGVFLIPITLTLVFSGSAWAFVTGLVALLCIVVNDDG